MSRATKLLLAGGAIALGAGLAGWWLMAPGTAPAPVAAPAAAISTGQDCSKYVRCMALKALRDASERCKEPIAQLAAFSAEWKEPGADSIFGDYVWLDQARGTITYLGNKVQFKNASGAVMPVAYECDFDPATGTVLDARARVGAPG